MKITHKRTDIDYRKLRAAFYNAKSEAVLYRKVERIKSHAIAIFMAHVRHTHGVTPPPYASAFKIRRVAYKAHAAWRLYNDDPAAFWVEYGAYLHHETHPRILRYRPLGRAIDAVAAEDV